MMGEDGAEGSVGREGSAGKRTNRICSFNKNRMLRKNTSQRRFNTAGARIVMSHKLPFDFFRPAEGKESSLWERSNKIDCAEFTFYRSNSEDKKPHHSKQDREYGTKLPPVSFKISKENASSTKVKKTSKVSSRWLQEKGFKNIHHDMHLYMHQGHPDILPEFCTDLPAK